MVGFGPSQYKWRVSRVTKSLHFRSLKGMSSTRRMNASYSLVIWGRTLAAKQKDDNVKALRKWMNKKLTRSKTNKAVDVKPESLTTPQVLSKPWGIVTHSSGRHIPSLSPKEKSIYFSNSCWNLAYQTQVSNPSPGQQNDRSPWKRWCAKVCSNKRTRPTKADGSHHSDGPIGFQHL